MNLKATKTPLLIAAMATAVTLTTFLPANAKAYWVSAATENAQVIDAKFTVKIKKHRSFKHHKPRHAKPYQGHRTHQSFKKKHASKHHGKKKFIFKKLH